MHHSLPREPAVSSSSLAKPQRCILTLDPALVVERLILRRLAELTRKRGQDWLRSLMGQGFLAEGRWLRNEQPGCGDVTGTREPAVPATSFASWLESRRPMSGGSSVPTQQAIAVPDTGQRPLSGSKPFAHLRAVIGGAA